MAIINNFPMEDSELYQIYQNPDIFPAVMKTGSSYNIRQSNKSILVRSYSTAEDEGFQEFSITIIPLRTVYVELNDKQIYATDSTIIELKPGHIYSVYRRSYATDYPPAAKGQGRYTLKEDGETIYDITTGYLRFAFNPFTTWSLTNE